MFCFIFYFIEIPISAYGKLNRDNLNRECAMLQLLFEPQEITFFLSYDP